MEAIRYYVAIQPKAKRPFRPNNEKDSENRYVLGSFQPISGIRNFEGPNSKFIKT